MEGGALKLPMGYRFLPSDVQLINRYLIPKVLRHVLPADVIPPIEVFRTNPWDLPGDSREKRYFFCKRGRKANSYKIVKGSGFWKATGKQQVIWDISSENAIGLKRKLIFCDTSTPSMTTTHDRWVMWEYRLATSINTNKKNAIEEAGDWMACSIICEQKKAITRRIQSRRNATIERENVGDGDVIDHCDYNYLVAKNQPCYNIIIINNSNNNNNTIGSPISSSSSTMTLANDEDFFSKEVTSSCLD